MELRGSFLWGHSLPTISMTYDLNGTRRKKIIFLGYLLDFHNHSHGIYNCYQMINVFESWEGKLRWLTFGIYKHLLAKIMDEKFTLRLKQTSSPSWDFLFGQCSFSSKLPFRWRTSVLHFVPCLGRSSWETPKQFLVVKVFKQPNKLWNV